MKKANESDFYSSALIIADSGEKEKNLKRAQQESFLEYYKVQKQAPATSKASTSAATSTIQFRFNKKGNIALLRLFAHSRIKAIYGLFRIAFIYTQHRY